MRVAVNPLQWFATADGGLDMDLSPPALERVLTEVRAAGFDAVHAQPPPDVGPEEYARLLAGHGLTPAPGYLSAPLTDRAALEDAVRAADAAAAVHAALGLTEIFVAADMAAERLRRPALPNRPLDEEALGNAVALLGAVGRATAAHGVRACLHNHVGSPIEARAEVEWILDRTDPAELGFGPDTGHLAWAGADPVAVLAAYRNRVAALHLKDVRHAAVEEARRRDLDYTHAVLLGVWAEPGHGDLDLSEALAVLAPFDGWVVVEVDRPLAATPRESARISADWLGREAPA